MILGLAHNLFRMFRENSDVVPVSQLRRQGVRAVTVLDWSRIEELAARAVDDVLRNRGHDFSPSALESVHREAREAFVRLIEERDGFKESARRLDQQRVELEDNLRLLRAEFERSAGRLVEQREQPPIQAEEVAVGPSGLDDLQKRLESEVTELVVGWTEEGVEGRRALAAKICELAARLLDEERQAAVQDALLAKHDETEKLERRVGKLRRMLDESESMVELLRKAKGFDDGISSVYREVQGLDEDGVAAGKQNLLDEIFRLNVELREAINESAETYATATAR